MESSAIADAQISASSAHDIGNVGPQHARYDKTTPEIKLRQFVAGALNTKKILLLLFLLRGSVKFIARGKMLPCVRRIFALADILPDIKIMLT